MFIYKIEKTMEGYANDVLVRSSNANEHIAYLESTFNILRNY